MAQQAELAHFSIIAGLLVGRKHTLDGLVSNAPTGRTARLS